MTISELERDGWKLNPEFDKVNTVRVTDPHPYKEIKEGPPPSMQSGCQNMTPTVREYEGKLVYFYSPQQLEWKAERERKYVPKVNAAFLRN